MAQTAEPVETPVRLIKKHKPVIAVNIITRTKKRYDLVWQTAVDGFCPSKVSAVCKGKANSHKCHLFYYELP